ncbi:GYD domain-containing protein [Alphaproteobacteria bacterium]|nr:GYD domain-containing protein [Alphaproteobacteria bacterium]
MRVLYIGMYSEAGLEGLERSSLAKRKEAAASIAKAAGGELLDLMYLQGDYDMAALMELPDIEAASGLLKAVNDSGAWEDMMMFPEFDLDKGLKAINAVKSSYKAPGKD